MKNLLSYLPSELFQSASLCDSNTTDDRNRVLRKNPGASIMLAGAIDPSYQQL